MFVIEVEFLSGKAYSGATENRREAEWPPHPLRLYSALVATAANCRTWAETEGALRWLEEQPPPAVVCADAQKCETGERFVPNNYPSEQTKGLVLPGLRGKAERVFPAVIPHGTTVRYEWEGDPDGAKIGILRELCERTGYLGSSSSRVRMCVRDGGAPLPDGRRWTAREGGRAGNEVSLRVPYPGRLDELRLAFERGLTAPPGAQAAYRTEEEAGSENAYLSMEIRAFRLEGGLAMTQACPLLERVRKALLKLADEQGLMVESLHGHGNGVHAALAALPDAAHPHSSGLIKGIGLALRREIPVLERNRMLRVFRSLRELHLGRAGVAEITGLEETQTQLKTLEETTWTRRAAVWASVTPMVLDRFPKDREGQRLGDIVAGACARIGLPAPGRFYLSRYAVLAAVPPVPAFQILRKAEEQRRPAFHAVLEFERAVEGPVLLGAMRHFGLGLFLPYSGPVPGEGEA